MKSLLGFLLISFSFAAAAYYEPYVGAGRSKEQCATDIVRQLIADPMFTELQRLGLRKPEVRYDNPRRGHSGGGYHVFLDDRDGKSFVGYMKVDFKTGNGVSCNARDIEIRKFKGWTFLNEWAAYKSKCARQMRAGERINERCIRN